MGYRDFPGIVLNSIEYPLAVEKDQRTGEWKRRQWSRVSKAMATKIEPRKNVRESDIKGEYIAVYDNWNRGLVGDGEDRPEGIYVGAGIHGLIPHTLRPAHAVTSVTHTTDEVTRPVWSGMFNGEFFVVAGRYCKRYANGAQTIDRDFGANVYATDAIVWNGVLYVCFGGTTAFIQSRTAAGTWATDGDVVADHFAIVENYLWKAYSTASVANLISNLEQGGNPFTIGSWSAGISVGEATYGITDLNGCGERVVVSKVEGMFLGDRNAIMPNVFPQFENAPSSSNGRNTFVRGTDIFYPTPFDTLRYDSVNEVAASVGLHHSFPTASTTDNIPSTRIVAMCAEGPNLWAVTPSGDFPRVRPTAVKKTTDNASSYTSYTVPFAANLSSLDTVANGDWLIVGFAASTPIYGLVIEIDSPNSNTSTLTVEYWNGTGWTAFAVIDDVWDGTRYVPTLLAPMVEQAQTMTTSGAITWATAPTTVAATIDTVSAHWYRLSTSAAFDSATTLTSIWGITRLTAPVAAGTDYPGAWLFRGRPRRAEDNAPTSIVWEPYTRLRDNVRPSLLSFIPKFAYPHTKRYGSLVVSGKQRTQFISPPVDEIDEPVSDIFDGAVNVWAISPMDDLGMPGTKKYFRGVTVRNRIGQENGSISARYRILGSASFSSTTGTPVNSEGVIAASGYGIQLAYFWDDTARADADGDGVSVQSAITLSAGGAQSLEAWPIGYEVEVRFRPLPTMKDEWVFPIELSQDVDTHLALLDALVSNSAAVALIDPTRTATSAVNVMDIQVQEEYMNEDGYPCLAVLLRVVEA